MTKILFILKYRESDYGDYKDSPVDPNKDWAYTKGLSSGLYNSARFVVEMLNENPNYEVKMVQVIDNNCIDREVTQFKPDIVVIEAYWVVPEKFAVLTKLHPKVNWIIRNHSNTPFLANEGIAFGWTIDYVKYPNVWVASNHKSAHRELGILIGETHPSSGICYLPNYYPVDVPHYSFPRSTKHKHVINVACFGAIRPLKNHVIQAIAAIEYAQKHGKHLKFHINGSRVEGNGAPILKNLRDIFSRVDNVELVEHPWFDHKEFNRLICKMDIGLQVSFTETFNIVAADFAVNNVPVVTSDEIHWSDPLMRAHPTDSASIVKAMERALFVHETMPWIKPHIKGLKNYNKMSRKDWYQTIDWFTQLTVE